MRTRILAYLWIGAIAIYLTALLVPLSTSMTRQVSVAALGAVWLGALVLLWRWRRVRLSLLVVAVLAALLLIAPGWRTPDPAGLRNAYTSALRRYEGAPYRWGGESPLGIDCSGLIRRGIIEALWTRGLLTGNGDLLRQGCDIWWHDCTAREMAAGFHGYTRTLFTTPDLNTLDPARIQPGDIAVTSSGIHVLGYVGDRTWIEADPGQMRVLIVRTPAPENLWMSEPMTIARWTILEP